MRVLNQLDIHSFYRLLVSSGQLVGRIIAFIAKNAQQRKRCKLHPYEYSKHFSDIWKKNHRINNHLNCGVSKTKPCFRSDPSTRLIKSSKTYPEKQETTQLL